MVRPRFSRLSAGQQKQILDAALREFAALGYAEASLNRIIQNAGISKGSMYYYFDGKEDLYLHVIRHELVAVFERVGPLPVPDTTDPDEFWAMLESHYRRVMVMLVESPHLAALIRGWLAGGAPTLQDAQREAEEAMVPWLVEAIAVGQRIGAVRSDVPTELLMAVVSAMGQAMDSWLITHPVEGNDFADAVHTLMEMIRNAVAPIG